ncbi:hypothetical protein AVEN_7371-1 [Araneus ventricosus]|uniref:DDE-1 domain-containing protein n=1 Tax=Araneus ventricosus TaxID=182803 RepID=A0A4Y2BRV3_ARAVE|nr:hypothetical protein AVEN_7371-1 [Araneus ventricosus]
MNKHPNMIDQAGDFKTEVYEDALLDVPGDAENKYRVIVDSDSEVFLVRKQIPTDGQLTIYLTFVAALVKKALIYLMGHGIYNIDESGVTTVQNLRKTATMNGTKQAGVVTTVERGNLVTMALAVSANGNSVPTFFPRKISKRHTSVQTYLKEVQTYQINLGG